MNIKKAIAKAAGSKSLSEKESFDIMTGILRGKASPAQIASLITAMRMKGEEIREITGFARAMREESEKVCLPGVEIVDTCGTGGDSSNTFNISTTAAFIAAGAGIIVAKHGNRSVSSKCGSADVLQELGINIMLGAEAAEECLRSAGIAFLFAPVFHSAMKHAAVPRKEIGIRTIFNILGPLTNPAGATSQILGVYDENLVEKMAYVLFNLGSKSAIVVHGKDRIDEISVSSNTLVAELKNKKVKTYVLNPEDYGIRKRPRKEMSGGNVSENAVFLKEVLKGKKGARRDVAVINAAAGIIAGGGAGDFNEGIEAAKNSIDSGSAFEKLKLLKRISNELKHT
jgi:anthranilate phosphoribosyltransferase